MELFNSFGNTLSRHGHLPGKEFTIKNIRKIFLLQNISILASFINVTNHIRNAVMTSSIPNTVKFYLPHRSGPDATEKHLTRQLSERKRDS